MLSDAQPKPGHRLHELITNLPVDYRPYILIHNLANLQANLPLYDKHLQQNPEYSVSPIVLLPDKELKH